MKKITVFLVFILNFAWIFGQGENPMLFLPENLENSGLKGTAIINDQESEVKNVVPMPKNAIFKPLGIQVIIVDKARQPQMLENSSSDSRVLFPDEYAGFIFDSRTELLEIIKSNYNLPAECSQAIQVAPKWLYNDLLLKFRLLNNFGLAKDYANVILKAGQNIKDEVAFQVAHLSVETLKDARFVGDKDFLIRNAEFIYKVDDSLKYVDLIEKGDYASGDYYTTTKYCVRNSPGGAKTWVEIPKGFYYWYIVLSKMDQEGVYVTDNNNDQSGQRTYGYSWRDFIWSNPDPAHDYRNVNITTSKGTVSSIPRFGEIIQKPDVLWDRQRSYYLFKRPYEPNTGALDLIGNWCSQAVPDDAKNGIPRAFQPNQILFQHYGNCNEDAFLVTAAARTALIPCIYLGTMNDDHVFSSIWDQDWIHYEFFRGGLSQNPANQGAWGMTNLLVGGTYENSNWHITLVDGTRPDGYKLNFTSYYTKTCTLNVNVADKNGKPIDGVQLIIYGKPGPYGADGYFYAGMGFTNHTGSVSIIAGDDKLYGIQLYHPTFGYLPDTKSIYIFNQTYSVSGANYTGTVNFPAAVMPELNATTKQAPSKADFGLKLNFDSKVIVTGINNHESQNSRFFYWDSLAGGNITFFLCDSVNFEKFKAGVQFEAYYPNLYKNKNTFEIGIPAAGKWYAIFSNKKSTANFQFLSSECSVIKDFSGTEQNNEVANGNLKVYPNPFGNSCRIEVPEGVNEVEIFDVFGNKIDVLAYPFVWQPELQSGGLYYIQTRGASRKYYGTVCFVK